jgi:hypothetical protein
MRSGKKKYTIIPWSISIQFPPPPFFFSRWRVVSIERMYTWFDTLDLIGYHRQTRWSELSKQASFTSFSELSHATRSPLPSRGFIKSSRRLIHPGYWSLSSQYSMSYPKTEGSCLCHLDVQVKLSMLIIHPAYNMFFKTVPVFSINSISIDWPQLSYDSVPWLKPLQGLTCYGMLWKVKGLIESLFTIYKIKKSCSSTFVISFLDPTPSFFFHFYFL